MSINTMPEQTLRAFADHGEIEPHAGRRPGRRSSARSADAAAAGIDLAASRPSSSAKASSPFCDSYRELLDCIEGQLGVLTPVGE